MISHIIDEDVSYHHPVANISIATCSEVDCVRIESIAKGRVLVIENQRRELQLITWQGNPLCKIENSTSTVLTLQPEPIELELFEYPSTNHDTDVSQFPPIEFTLVNLSDGTIVCLQQLRDCRLAISHRYIFVMHTLKAIYTNGNIQNLICFMNTSEGKSIHQSWACFHIASHQFLKECSLSILLFDIYLEDSKQIFLHRNDKKLKDNFLWEQLDRCHLQFMNTLQGAVNNFMLFKSAIKLFQVVF